MKLQGALCWQRGGLSKHPDVLNLYRDFAIYTYLSSFENQMRVIWNIQMLPSTFSCVLVCEDCTACHINFIFLFTTLCLHLLFRICI